MAHDPHLADSAAAALQPPRENIFARPGAAPVPLARQGNDVAPACARRLGARGVSRTAARRRLPSDAFPGWPHRDAASSAPGTASRVDARVDRRSVRHRFARLIRLSTATLATALHGALAAGGHAGDLAGGLAVARRDSRHRWIDASAPSRCGRFSGSRLSHHANGRSSPRLSAAGPRFSTICASPDAAFAGRPQRAVGEPHVRTRIGCEPDARRLVCSGDHRARDQAVLGCRARAAARSRRRCARRAGEAASEDGVARVCRVRRLGALLAPVCRCPSLSRQRSR